MIAKLDNLSQVTVYRPIKVGTRFPYDRIIIHHTADITDFLKSDGLFAAELDHIHRTGGRAGYPPFVHGLGYHFVIDPTDDKGRTPVEVGDRWLYQIHGAHTVAHNYHALGICLVGNFSKGEPSNGQLGALEQLLAALRPVPIYPHRAFSATECPGKNIDDAYWLENFQPLSLVKS